MNREQFIARFNEIMRNHGRDCSNDDHPLWNAEKSFTPRVVCKWFVCVKPIKLTFLDRAEADYWNWVANTLSGKVVCYASDTYSQEEWWGFTDEKDVPIWMLKWGS